jgi:hypothetical protein
MESSWHNTSADNEPAVLELSKEHLDEMLACAAERGAERALAHLGIANGHAAHDMRELRGLRDRKSNRTGGWCRAEGTIAGRRVASACCPRRRPPFSQAQARPGWPGA